MVHDGLMDDPLNLPIEQAMEQVSRTLPGDAPEAASVREQLSQEMEQQMVAQEQELEAGTGVPIVEQDDGLDVHASLSSDVISVSTGTHASGAVTDHGADNAAFTDPGAGTAPDSSHIREGDYDNLADLEN